MTPHSELRAEEPATQSPPLAVVPSGPPRRSIVRRLLSFRPLRRRWHVRAEFLEALDEVASAVSSTRSLDEVLETVVLETRRVVGSRKAALCLLDEGADTPVVSRVVVRGSRAELPESWWLDQLEQTLSASATRVPHLNEDRDGRGVMLSVPVQVRGETVGILAAMDVNSRLFDDDKITLLAVLGAFAGAAIENARLVVQSESSLLAGERNRIAKEMHDGLAQSLFSASLALELCKKRLASDPSAVGPTLGEIQQQLSDSLAELRSFIYDLRPIRLDRLGLVGALQTRVEQLGKTSRVRGRVEVEGAEREIPPEVEACLYRVAQECIANVVKHARRASMHVTFTYGRDHVVLEISDDGPGFAVQEAVRNASAGSSLGLQSIRDRVRAAGGRLHISSTLGVGTNVWVRIPC